jgi:hypothetical protein
MMFTFGKKGRTAEEIEEGDEMRRFLCFVSTAAAVSAAWAAGASASHDPLEWDLAVAALGGVSTAAPPVNDPAVVTAVGGGRLGPAPKFGFGATLGPAGPRGTMTISEGVGTPVVESAQVFCLAAARLPGGGAVATILGEVDPPQFGVFPTMVFQVTDSGLPGGAGDEWSGALVLEPPELALFQCVPRPGGVPITEGAIVVHVP